MSKRLGIVASAVLFSCVVAGGVAHAQDKDDGREVCLGGIHGYMDPNVLISACTRFIESGAAEPEERAMALANRGEMYISVGRNDDAMQDCQSALRIAPRQVMTGKICGDAYLAKGDADTAISHYTNAIRNTSVFLHGLWLGRIQADLAAKRYDDALSDASYFIARDKSNGDAYVLRGKAHFALREYGEAQGDFEQALRIDPTSFEAQQGLSQVKTAQRPAQN
jgi:tetratricopeptide (TPR) repeat protein